MSTAPKGVRVKQWWAWRDSWANLFEWIKPKLAKVCTLISLTSRCKRGVFLPFSTLFRALVSRSWPAPRAIASRALLTQTPRKRSSISGNTTGRSPPRSWSRSAISTCMMHSVVVRRSRIFASDSVGNAILVLTGVFVVQWLCGRMHRGRHGQMGHCGTQWQLGQRASAMAVQRGFLRQVCGKAP